MRKIKTAIKYFYLAFIKNDEYSKYVLAENIVKLVYPKYKFSEFGRLYLDDENFISEFYLPWCGKNFHSLDRKFFLKELIELVRGVSGDTVECGVYTGASSYLICLANHTSTFEKTHHLFDSFEGLSTPSEKDGSYWQSGNLTASEDLVRENLKDFTNCKYYKGWIPTQFNLVAERRFSFVHIDVDLYKPTLDSIAFFYDRLEVGGIILCDDYGFSSCPGAKDAMDEFFSSKKEQIVHVPTGQAFIIKQKE